VLDFGFIYKSKLGRLLHH
jgi:hypothetical protein